VIIVVLISLIRTFIAFHVPLTEDEAYYWAWSRHPAFGYTDHPPMVAWLIALTAPFGQSPGLIRLPFITCEALTALALGRTAFILSGNALAGTAATIAFTLIPQVRLTIGEALPDGPYLLCWSLALMLMARICRKATLGDISLLGVALGGALLSRFFGWALLAGIVAYTFAPQRRALWKQGFWIAPTIALALYVPFIAWNASHGWENLTFTVHDRQRFQAFSAEHLAVLSTLRFLAYAIALWTVGFFVALRPGNALVAWTTLPFPTFLALLSCFEVVESYWLLGPFASLCVGIGIAYAGCSQTARRALSSLAIPSAYTMLSALFLTLPEPTQASLLRAPASPARGWYSGTYAYDPLAHDVRDIAAHRCAMILTDRFEIAAELAYHGVDSVIIGHSPQIRQWARWYAPRYAPKYALLVTFFPPKSDTMSPLTGRMACIPTQPSDALSYQYAGLPAATFFTAWCIPRLP
jgi:hypothetical protein